MSAYVLNTFLLYCFRLSQIYYHMFMEILLWNRKTSVCTHYQRDSMIFKDSSGISVCAPHKNGTILQYMCDCKEGNVAGFVNTRFSLLWTNFIIWKRTSFTVFFSTSATLSVKKISYRFVPTLVAHAWRGGGFDKMKVTDLEKKCWTSFNHLSTFYNSSYLTRSYLSYSCRYAHTRTVPQSHASNNKSNACQS